MYTRSRWLKRYVDGCTADLDPDCEAVCGNGVTEPGELCDGDDCLEECVSTDACFPQVLVGSVEDCNVACQAVEEVTLCQDGDGCCPSDCNNFNDSDCEPAEPACGNGVVEGDELCDGNCPVSCVSESACVPETLIGSAGACDAQCVPVPITKNCFNDDSAAQLVATRAPIMTALIAVVMGS